MELVDCNPAVFSVRHGDAMQPATFTNIDKNYSRCEMVAVELSYLDGARTIGHELASSVSSYSIVLCRGRAKSASDDVPQYYMLSICACNS